MLGPAFARLTADRPRFEHWLRCGEGAGCFVVRVERPRLAGAVRSLSVSVGYASGMAGAPAAATRVSRNGQLRDGVRSGGEHADS